MFNNYPYTDTHELNLDWILKKIKELKVEIDDFKVVNNITFSGQWDITKQYPAWTIVSDNNIGYVSIQPVPVGVPLSNGNYWVEVIDYTAQIAGLETRVIDLENTIGDNSSGLVHDMNDVQAYITMLNNRKVFFVGPTCEYTTINDAITDARLICSETDRVTIVVKPGTYTEQITLQPNPGIDIIGYDAIVVNSANYPDSPLYTSGRGTFIGLEFYYNGTGTNYGCHIEHATPVIPAHTTTFIDCKFRSRAHSALGIGMSPGSTLKLINCEAITEAASGKPGLFIHNYDGNATQQQFVARNCVFKGSDDYDDILVQDPTMYPTLKNYNSILVFEMTNCSGKIDSTARFNTMPSGDPQETTGYMVNPATNNIRLDVKSVHNDFLAFNVRGWQPYGYEMTVPIAPNGQVSMPTPLGKSGTAFEFRSKQITDGNNTYTLGTPTTNISHWIWNLGGVLPSGTNAKIMLNIAPAHK